MHTEPPKTFNNYLVSINYLEYASFLLSDIEYFLLYSDISTKASRFSNIEKRFQVIQNLILRSSDNFLSKNNYFDRPFKLHFEYLNWFYDVTIKEFDETFKIQDESGAFEQDMLDVIETSIKFYDAFQAYLPMNHNEFFLYESAKFSSLAFTDCFIAGENILSGNTKLSMEYTESALDMLERAYQAVDKDSYRRQEYDALIITLNPRYQEQFSFKYYQDLHKIYIASCYQENVLMKQLFLVSSLNMDESIPEETLDKIGETIDLISKKMPDFVATRNESALLMISSKLNTSGQEIDDLEMLFPPKEFSTILKSNSYNYLNNLPIKVNH